MATLAIPRPFPAELLTHDVTIRQAYFKQKLLNHPRLQAAYDQLRAAIQEPAGANLILVYGPSGVGKTTLWQRLAAKLRAEGAADPAGAAGPIPVAGVEVVAPDSGHFDWKDFYLRTLRVLDDPGIADPRIYTQRWTSVDAQGHLQIDPRTPTATLRRVLEDCLRQRRLRALVLDEAQHFQKMASGRRLLDQMDTLKSLANLTDTVLVLVGTYELLGLADLSAQLTRRSREVHFPRYQAEAATDVAEFGKFLRSLQRHLPLENEPDLEAHTAYFYNHCFGCPGLLKTWLLAALNRALDSGAPTLQPQHWQACAESPRRLKQIEREIWEGEGILQADAPRGQLPARRYGITLLAWDADPPELPAPEPAESRRAPPAEAPDPLRARPARHRRGRIGQRNPQRDPVGQGAEAP